MMKAKKIWRDFFSESGLAGTFRTLCAAVFFLLTYFALGSTWENGDLSEEYLYVRPDSLLENVFWTALLFTAVCGAAWIAAYVVRRSDKKILMQVAAGFVSILVMGLSVWWIRASDTIPIADQLFICNAADSFNAGDFSLLGRGFYVGACRQQLGMITFIRVIFTVFGAGSYRFIQYFSAFMAGCLVFSGFQITRLLSDEDYAAECTYLILAFLCAPLYIYTCFVYGEIISTAFVALSAWMLLKYMKKRSAAALILLGMACGIAVQFRQNAIIFVVGYFIVLLVKFISKPDRAVVFAAFSILAGVLLWGGIVYGLYADKIPADSKSMPASLYIAMGTNNTKPNPGWYNSYHWDTFHENDCDPEAAKEAAWDTIRGFLAHCREDHAYAVDFFTRKINAQWNAPMYQALAMNNCVGEEQSDFAAAVYFGDMRPRAEAFMNIYQLLVYGAVLFLLSVKRKEWRQIDRYILLVGIFGGFLFSILWEAKTRYIFPYFLMMLPYAAVGINAAGIRIRNRVGERIK